MSEHTPLPWVKNDLARIESEKEHGWVNDGWIICDCDGPDGEHNAAFIVRAVNSHDELVAACRLASQTVEEITPFVNDDVLAKISVLIANTNAAISKAETP